MHISRIRSEVQNRKISIIKIGKRAAENASNWRVGQLLVLQAECRTPARCFDLALKFNFCFDALVRASISCPIRKSVWTQKYFESLSSIISNAHLLRFIASWEENQLLFQWKCLPYVWNRFFRFESFQTAVRAHRVSSQFPCFRNALDPNRPLSLYYRFPITISLSPSLSFFTSLQHLKELLG